MTKDDQNFTWNEKKLNIAKEMASGTKSQRQIAEELDCHESTISKLKQIPEFMMKVDEFTIAHERGSIAGLLRMAYQGLDIKEGKIPEDKTTAIDFAKLIADLQGHTKQRIEHSGATIDTIKIVMKKEEEKN